MSLMEQFANPEYFDSLTFGDKMLGSTITMIMGIGITFIVLCILWAFIAIMGKVMGLATAKKAAAAAPAPAPAPAAAAAPAPAQDNAEDANVIAAVIAAAIAAYGGEEEIKTNLVVKKIRRVSGATTAWSESARADVIESRKF